MRLISQKTKCEHSIEVTTDKEIKQTSRRIPFALRDEVKRKIDEMLSAEPIRENESPLASPIVLVKKINSQPDYTKPSSTTTSPRTTDRSSTSSNRIRPNVTINLIADRILRGIIGRGRMMSQLQGPVPNPEQPGAAIPIESEDEDQAFTPEFSFKYFDLKEIDESLSELSNSSSGGYIGIHTKVLKAIPEIFSPILLKLFNSCLELKKIPEDWKIAIVTPLYKNKGDKTKMDNYRAFSVLSPIAKMFEKLLAKQVLYYFESNKIFFKGQHGFKTGFSCQTAIHEFISYINNALDHKLITLALFIDLRKAFDLIDSLILLLKLFHYGFDINSLGLISDYFNNRSQIVKLQNTHSNPGKLKYGVPQGAFIELFADDRTLAKSGEKLKEILKDFEQIIEDLNVWCYFNKVDINWNKTYVMIFTKKKIEIQKKIEIKGASIAVVSEFKLLGFTIDDKLNFIELVSE
ncbi:unnamed protein product, partial [Brachionus calyciflorus]